jgi:hypothetical protein
MMKRQNPNRPDESNDSKEWLIYQSLRKKYEAYKALTELASQAGRLPEYPVKDKLLASIHQTLQVTEVEINIEKEPSPGDEKEAPYKKFLRKAKQGYDHD